jgi:hypothetical protein
VPHGTLKNRASGSGLAKHRGAYNIKILLFSEKFLKEQIFKGR